MLMKKAVYIPTGKDKQINKKSSPHCTLCGNVQVGEGTWIGAGSTVIPGVKIGKWSVIGAGSVVVRDIPDGVLALGNRCEVIKKLL